MKLRIAFLFLFLFFVCGISGYSQNGTVTITQIHQKDSVVEITVTSSKHLYVGANPYVLYIDGKYFDRSKQPKGGKGLALTFYVPIEDYRELTDGASATMVYGYDNAALIKNSDSSAKRKGDSKHWQLGTLNKKMQDN